MSTRKVWDHTINLKKTFVRVTRVELLGESSVYKYTLEYITAHLPEESSENRIRLLKGNLHYIYKFP